GRGGWCVDEDFQGGGWEKVGFRLSVYRAAGKHVVLPLIEMLWLQAGPFLALSLTTPGVRWTARHHQSVLAAFRASLGPSARRAIEADIEDTSVQLLKRAIFEDTVDTVSSDNHLMLVSPQ